MNKKFQFDSEMRLCALLVLVVTHFPGKKKSSGSIPPESFDMDFRDIIFDFRKIYSIKTSVSGLTAP